MDYIYEHVKVDENWPIKIIVHTTEEKAFIPRHWHESVEISYVLQGRIDEIYIEGITFASEKGDIVVINSNAIHSFLVTQGKGRLALTLLIPYDFLKENYSEMDRFAFDCISSLEREEDRQSKFNELRGILDRMYFAYMNRKGNSLADIEIRGLTYNLIYILLKQFLTEKPGNGVINSNKHLKRLTKITAYIKRHYNQDLSIDVLASEFGLTEAYLSRFFKRHIGMTIHQYINAIRLEHAYRDLMNTDHPITHIVYEHGFPNEKSFNRVFKAVYRETPHEHRKNKYSGQNLPVKKL